MRYFGLFSVLTSLFLMVGCGSKNVDSKSDFDSGEKRAKQQTNDTTEGMAIDDSANASRGKDNFVPVPGNSSDYDDQSYVDSSGSSTKSDDVSPYDSYGASDSNASGQDIILSSPVPIYFDFNRYDIRPDMRDYIVANAKYINENNVKKLVLQGNTDQVGGDEYNLALGQKRALSVRDALVLQGIPKNVFQVVSFGSSKPVCSYNTAECRAKNRRTDIVEKK